MIATPVLPMLAQKVAAPRGRVSHEGADEEGGKRWPILLRTDVAWEPKFDGNRMIVEARSGRVRLWARSQNDVTRAWPEIVPAFERADGVFDGEIIVLGRRGDESHTFNALQNVGSMSSRERSDRVRFVLWDVLEANGEDVHGRSYEERRAIIDRAHENGVGPWARTGHESRVVLTPSVRDGVGLWNTIIDHRMEGVIAKPLRSTYQYGSRAAWLKLKALQRTELVVIGYTDGRGDHGKVVTPFGALVLGEWIDGHWRYAGKVGTGFTDETARLMLHTLRQLETDDPPSTNAAFLRRVRSEVTPRRLMWVRPIVTVTIEFQDRGKDAIPRFPSFKGVVSVEA